MSEATFEKTTTYHKPGLGETLVYRTLVTSLFLVSSVGILAGRVMGRKATGSLWQESKEAAYAVAGYAFKH